MWVYSHSPSLQMLLTATVALLVLLVIYLATHYTHHSMLLQQQQHQRHWLAGLPSHFTIPILSPFTSVVRTPRMFVVPQTLIEVYIGRERDFGDRYKIYNGDVLCSWSDRLFDISTLAKLKGRGGGFEVSRLLAIVYTLYLFRICYPTYVIIHCNIRHKRCCAVTSSHIVRSFPNVSFHQQPENRRHAIRVNGASS